MAAEEPAPPNLLKNLLVFTENEQIPSIVGTDANAHHTKWISSDINPREEDLLAYCVSADLNFCNVGNKPTFRTKAREEVLDLTLVNRCTWDRVVGWRVSNVPSFSDHMYIRFQVKSRIRKQAKMFCNVRCTCWNKHVNELEQKLNEQILRPVPVPSSKEDIDVPANKVHPVITYSYEAACPMRKSLRKKDKHLVEFWASKPSKRGSPNLAKSHSNKKRRLGGSKVRPILLQKSCQKSKARFMALLCREYE